jgi:D-tyrosyl-tRNA(Tyr) deacylase
VKENIVKLLIQRVRRASVSINDETIASISRGLLVFVGVTQSDQAETAQHLAEKVSYLRIFDDSDEKMNLDIQQIGGEVLVVSQFTLYADISRGRRPGFSAKGGSASGGEQAAKPDHAELVYRFFCQALRRLNLKVQEGRFQEQMIVSLENDGPATFILER